MTMLKLRKKHVTPPGGYRYHDPDLNMNFSANTLATLVSNVATTRKINSKETIPNLAEIIEDSICQVIPQSFVLGEKDMKQRQYMPLSVVKIATETFLTDWRISGRQYASREETNNRAEICTKCPENRVNKACLGCRGLTPWVKNWTQRSTGLDDDLLICNCTAVMNVAAIHPDKSYIVSCTTKQQLGNMPDTCWRKKLCEAR
jgi:hypothetical protein